MVFVFVLFIFRLVGLKLGGAWSFQQGTAKTCEGLGMVLLSSPL